jgi:myo-inositol-1(or 4)-monophosphatase
MTDYLSVIEPLAREAGAILRAGYGRGLNGAGGGDEPIAVEYKGAIDLVTDYDRRSEVLIIAGLRQAFPTHTIYAEESGRSAAQAEYEWLVDPLDGTTNFAHAFPFFAVSIALVQRGRLLAGVVYDPLRDELFSAAAEAGATLNGHPLRVSAQADLGRAFLATGFAYDVRTNPHNNFAEFRQFHLRALAVRRAGAAALDCAYVAAGRLDGYWEYRIKPWDIGAGALIAMEAGGRVTTADGRADFLTVPSIVVSNGTIHEQMLRVLREGDKAPHP